VIWGRKKKEGKAPFNIKKRKEQKKKAPKTIKGGGGKKKKKFSCLTSGDKGEGGQLGKEKGERKRGKKKKKQGAKKKPFPPPSIRGGGKKKRKGKGRFLPQSRGELPFGGEGGVINFPNALLVKREITIISS